MAISPELQKIHEALEEYTKSGALDKVADSEPVATDAVGPDLTTKSVIGSSDMFRLKQEMLRKSQPELLAIFNEQASHSEVGIPLGVWMSRGGNAEAINQALSQNTPDAQFLRKAMDTAGASALIRQDLEPVLAGLFVKQFPAWERIRKIPANGLVHAWNQITDFGDAQFMPELGTVTDDNNTYVRATTNVAILARRVGVSLKSQFAVQAGGAGYNLEQEELTGGLRAIAHRLQKTIFQGNATITGATANDEEGEYDANAFTGLRQLLMTADTDINVSDTTPTDRDDITTGFNAAVLPITNNGGAASVIFMRPDEYNEWNRQQLPIVRIMDRTEFVPGVRVSAVATSAGDLPLVVVPGDSIGTYDNDANGKESADAYVIDENDLALPYLGSDGITTLDIPIGVAGQLVHYFILFCMYGLQLKTTLWSRKLRMQIEA